MVFKAKPEGQDRNVPFFTSIVTLSSIKIDSDALKLNFSNFSDILVFQFESAFWTYVYLTYFVGTRFLGFFYS